MYLRFSPSSSTDVSVLEDLTLSNAKRNEAYLDQDSRGWEIQAPWSALVRVCLCPAVTENRGTEVCAERRRKPVSQQRKLIVLPQPGVSGAGLRRPDLPLGTNEFPSGHTRDLITSPRPQPTPPLILGSSIPALEALWDKLQPHSHTPHCMHGNEPNSSEMFIKSEKKKNPENNLEEISYESKE